MIKFINNHKAAILSGDPTVDPGFDEYDIIEEEKTMKCKVKLTRTVELVVEGKDEEAILNWLCVTTPEEAYLLSDGSAEEEYTEEIVCCVADDSIVNYVIKEGQVK